ncbi:hypothetical protein ACIA3K_07780 [Micromonospora sp. NPDC051543]|uniref:hypothetical protein n=1 Tax=Micromonospora sp. NPDC051543 TaxID=3364287 RepID=UPI0037BADCB1
MSAAPIGSLVKRLSALYPRDDDAQMAAAIAKVDDEQLGFAIAKEKAATLAMNRLAAIAPERVERLRTVTELAARLDLVGASRQRFPALCAKMDEAAGRMGMPIWTIKGLGALEWYQDPYARDIGCDVDVMVTDVDHAMTLTTWLRSTEGYDYTRQELPWLKATAAGEVYGQVNLSHPDPEIPSVDIHFGGYSVRHCGWLPLIGPTPPPGLHSYSPTGTVLHVVANSAGDYFVLAKDLNDLAAALSDDRIDWDVVLSNLDAVALTGYLGYLLGEVIAFQALDEPLLAKAQRLRDRCPAKRLRPATADYWGASHWRRRWIGTSLHAFELGRRRSLKEGVRLGVSAARYYRPRLKLAVRKDAEPLRLAQLTSWECIRLVPTDVAAELVSPAPPRSTEEPDGARDPLGKQIEIVRTGAGDLVRTPDTVFVPTLDYNLSESLVRSVA